MPVARMGEEGAGGAGEEAARLVATEASEWGVVVSAGAVEVVVVGEEDEPFAEGLAELAEGVGGAELVEDDEMVVVGVGVEGLGGGQDASEGVGEAFGVA